MCSLRSCAAILAALAALIGLSTPATADAHKPLLQHLTVTPWPIPAAGGAITLKFHGRYVSSCRIVGFGSERPFRCSGWVSHALDWPARQSASETSFRVVIAAKGPGGRAHPAWLFRQARVALDGCTKGPECDYGPVGTIFRRWGNVAPENIGDCTFAAAANWEQIVLGVHANEAVIGREFAEAGGSSRGGLSESGLWSYWQKDGIAGVHLIELRSLPTDRAAVGQDVRDYTAMIVELHFDGGSLIGWRHTRAGLHDVVIDGLTPEGPLVVTWGETLQMTWEQWRDEVVGMWGIDAS